MSTPTLSSNTPLHIQLRHRGPLLPSSPTTTTLLPHPPAWWKDATVYQVWPASFLDTTATGLGDLNGITSKLDHLSSLGVDTIWLSPMYDSPQEDMGYDISDYEKVYPPYGTMEDMERLIKEAHGREIRVVLDLVVNHTSSEHKWFKRSCEGKAGDGGFGDFYIWKDGKRGKDGKMGPPNNWAGAFGGSAWKWVEKRQQYYLHLFAEGQPDLNWERREVRDAVYESALRFWLRKGVDGFRVDTCNIYSKFPGYEDGEVTPGTEPFGEPWKGVVNGPQMHEIWLEIRRDVLEEFGDVLMVGELGRSSFKETLRYIGREPRELSMVFDFTYVELGRENGQLPHQVEGYKLPEAKKALKRTQDYVAEPLAWSSVFKENHDQPRSVSRHATTDPKYWEMAAKVLAMMTATLSGTLYLYQGEEIGMTNIPESWSPDDLRDILSINYWKRMKTEHPNDHKLLEKAWKGICLVSRDNARTPVQWTGEEHAGFTTGKPWMRVNENYQDGINVEYQQKKSDSVLSFWKQLLKLRKKHSDMFVHGSYKVHDLDNEQTWTFEKRAGHGQVAWVVLNMSNEEADWSVPSSVGKLVLCNNPKPGKRLQPFEGRIYV